VAAAGDRKGTPVSNPGFVSALAAFVELIKTPAGRKAFLDDPERALADQGADVNAIPPDLLEVLKELEKPELRLLDRLNTAMVGQGLTVNDQATLGYL